jgi:hypothetical protein
MYNYHQDYIKKHGININTKFVNIGNFAKHFDQLDNHPIIPSKFNNQVNKNIVDLYV